VVYANIFCFRVSIGRNGFFFPGNGYHHIYMFYIVIIFAVFMLFLIFVAVVGIDYRIC
jgi:hypothetical protein